MYENLYHSEYARLHRSDPPVFMPVEHPPDGYPERPVPDAFTGTPFLEAFEDRREAFRRHCLENPSPHGFRGLFHELVRITDRHAPVHEKRFEDAVEAVISRSDGSGLLVIGLVRLLFQFPGSPSVSRHLYRRAEEAILGFGYSPGEPGMNSQAFWTTGSQIVYSVAEYLAGRLYPHATFSNSGRTGEVKQAAARERIVKWLELRFRTGMNEWLSETPYDESMTALLALVDFSDDPELVRRAVMVLDLLVFDLALYGRRGTFSPSQGRVEHVRRSRDLPDLLSDTMKLLFGTGVFSRTGSSSSVSFVLSPMYRIPEVLYRIAVSGTRSEEILMQRTGMNVREAFRWGMDFRKPENAMAFLSFEAFAHPDLFPLTLQLFDRYGLWEHESFRNLGERRSVFRALRYSGLYRFLSGPVRETLNRTAKEENNLYSFMTGDYQLSTSQDYRKGRAGAGQRVWQASLGSAVCFTSHPGNTDPGTEVYWTGRGILPRAAQVRNVAIILYNLSRVPGLLPQGAPRFTHAWFPRSSFDDRFEQGGWIFGRKGEGYLALFSARGYRWQDSGPDAGSEVIAEGGENIWICELGNSGKGGSFLEFVDGILGSTVEHHGLRVRYRSPSLGLLEFGWKEPLRRNGLSMPIEAYNRYDNPYCLASYPSEEITIREKDSSLTLNFASGVRNLSGTV